MSLASLVHFFAVLFFFFFRFCVCYFAWCLVLGVCWCLDGEKTWESKGIFWVCLFLLGLLIFSGFLLSGFVNFFFFVCFLRK